MARRRNPSKNCDITDLRAPFYALRDVRLFLHKGFPEMANLRAINEQKSATSPDSVTYGLVFQTVRL